jgi:hypothetical protein
MKGEPGKSTLGFIDYVAGLCGRTGGLGLNGVLATAALPGTVAATASTATQVCPQ